MSLGPGSVWLDAQGAQLNPGRGIARYTTEHLRALLQIGGEAIGAVRVNPDHPLPPEWETLTLPPLVHYSARGGGDSGAPAIYHVMSPFDALPLDDVWPPWARRRAERTVVTLYDLIPYLLPDRYLQSPRVRAGYAARLGMVRSADQIVALSEITAADAVDHLGIPSRRITVIEAGVSAELPALVGSPEQAREILRRELPEVSDGFVLYVGGADARKNLEGLIHGYGLVGERLRARHQLVIACSLDHGWEGLVRGWAEGAGIAAEQLALTGFVSDEQLVALYRACRLFVFPSLYEGFGLPIIEAAACGAPVIASRRSTSAEVLGGVRGTFDPEVPAEVAATIERALTDDGLAAELGERSSSIAGRFTWERVAERTLGAYERALAAPSRRRRARSLPRVALFTPWPPDRSGIADYNRRLAAELGKIVDLDVVVGDDEQRYRSANGSAILARRFDWLDRLRPHDAVLYAIGNSAMHAHVYEAMMRRPGAVVAHDVRLSGFYSPYAELADPGDPDHWFATKLGELYGDHAPGEPDRLALPWSTNPEACRLYMTGEVQQRAERLFVHSSEARRILAADAPALGAAEPELLPFAVPEPRSARADGRWPGAPLIAAHGSLSPAKPTETILSGFAEFAAGRPQARLVIAGHALGEELERLRLHAAELGVGDQAQILGRLDEDGYWELLGAADVSIQLRTTSHGEASAAVCDAIAARVPVIVSDVGWYGELPDGVAMRLPVGASPAAIAGALEEIAADPGLREAIRAGQRDYAARHSFAAVAEAYAAALLR